MDPMFEVQQEKSRGNYASFVISPLEAGYGNTMGVALRRVLLSSLPGAAITKVRISGIKHQFSTLKGMKEDVLDFLLNLKKVRIAYSGDKPAKLSLSVTKAGEVKAGDIKIPATVKITNPELVLANLTKGAKIDADMEAEVGVGYSSSEDREKEGIGIIPLDATFSPVLRVNYKVEETRVGRLTNYDKLTFEVWTDGTITPRGALEKGAQILLSYFNQIVNPKKVKKVAPIALKDELGSIGKLSVEEIGLPTRVANALIKVGYDTVEKLTQAKKEDLIRVRNLGEKSIKVIKVALLEKGVDLPNA